MLLEQEKASAVIDEAIAQGADFCDIYVEKMNFQNLKILHSDVEEIDTGIDFGLGIRLLYGTKVLYGYTNRTDIEELKRIVRTLSALDRKEPHLISKSFEDLSIKSIHPAVNGLDHAVPMEEKINFLMQIDKHARSLDSRISQVNATSIEWFKQVEIFNSEGLHATDNRNYTRIANMVIAQDGGEQASAFEGPGGLSGWEVTNRINPKELAENVTRQVLTKLGADPCPAGKMPVILDNGFGGVIFHEACGHLLETTSVQKKASVFWDKMDTMIANPVVSAVDDGTMPNQWGSINIDDEGMPTQKTQLIKDGKLTNFLVDKVGNLKTGHPRSGSGRKQNYKFAPASRMRNTFIEPGDSSLDEMIGSVDRGIYCKKMGGGSVSPGTGEFNFAAQETYLIENGKISKPLKSATLIGTGPEVLQKISMVGKNFDLAPGMCGSVSGAVPTTVGQPALKIDEILVGGQE